MGSEGVVAVGKGIKFVLHGFSVEGVKVDSLVELTVGGGTASASNDVGGRADVMEDGLVDSHEGSGSGSHLRGVVDGSLGDDGAVGNNDARPLELGFEVIDNNGGNLLVVNERSEGDSDEEVVRLGLISSRVLNKLDGVNEDTLKLGALGLEGAEGFGDLFVEVGDLLVSSLDDLRFVEHL